MRDDSYLALNALPTCFDKGNPDVIILSKELWEAVKGEDPNKHRELQETVIGFLKTHPMTKGLKHDFMRSVSFNIYANMYNDRYMKELEAEGSLD